MNKIEYWVEAILWNSRFVVMFAVVASLIVSLVMFYIATIDVFYLVSHVLHYASPDLEMSQRNILRSTTVTHVVEVVDGYLLATVMLIFSLGLYELFISKIDMATEETSANVLLINSLDDLKTRLAKVILMILIVKYFEHAISMKFNTPLELLELSAGIATIGLALYLTHQSEGKKT